MLNFGDSQFSSLNQFCKLKITYLILNRRLNLKLDLLRVLTAQKQLQYYYCLQSNCFNFFNCNQFAMSFTFFHKIPSCSAGTCHRWASLQESGVICIGSTALPILVSTLSTVNIKKQAFFQYFVIFSIFYVSALETGKVCSL